MMAMVDVVS